MVKSQMQSSLLETCSHYKVNFIASTPIGEPQTVKPIDTRLGQLPLKQRILQLHKSSMDDNGVLPKSYKGFAVQMSAPEAIEDNLEMLTLGNSDSTIIKDKYWNKDVLNQEYVLSLSRIMAEKTEEELAHILG